MAGDSLLTSELAKLQRLAEKSLEAWGLSAELQLIKHRENAVYRVQTTQGQKYALRVHRSNYHTDASLRSELAWMQALDQAGIGVPKPVPTVQGELFAVVSIDELPEPRQVDLLTWVDGEQLGSVEDGLGDNAAEIDHIYREIGRVAASVHNQATQWRVPANFERHAWDADGLVGDNPFWGRFWELTALTDEQRALLLDAREKVRRDLDAFGRSPDEYSLIHADFVPENFLIDGHKVSIIDFDDAGFGWHLFEIATALYFIQDDPHFEQAKNALIEGYRECRPLSDQQLAQLPLSMAARSFTYLGWVHTRSETQTAAEMTPVLVDMCFKAVNSYLNWR